MTTPTPEEVAKARELAMDPLRSYEFGAKMIAFALADARVKALEEAAKLCDSLTLAVPLVGDDVPAMITRSTFTQAAHAIRALKGTP